MIFYYIVRTNLYNDVFVFNGERFLFYMLQKLLEQKEFFIHEIKYFMCFSGPDVGAELLTGIHRWRRPVETIVRSL